MRKACLLASILMIPCLGAWTCQQDHNSNPASSGDQAPAANSTASAQGSTAVGTVALLRVYRQRRYYGWALSPSINVDGKRVVHIDNGRRVTIKLIPGSHTITSDDKATPITIDAMAGQDYYVRVDEEPGFWKAHGRLTLVMEAQGGPEYEMLKPLEKSSEIAIDMIQPDQDEVAPPKSR